MVYIAEFLAATGVFGRHVPEHFRDTFLLRQPVQAELLALAGRAA